MAPDLPPPTGRRPERVRSRRRAACTRCTRRPWRARVLDVAGLTLAALRLLRMEPRVLAHYRERFQHVLVDELQDTSVVQYDWLHLLSGGTARKGAEAGAADVAGPAQSIFAAADDDQAIYSWRGADRANVLRFCRDFGAVQVLRLPNSYRCPAHVYAAAQARCRRAAVCCRRRRTRRSRSRSKRASSSRGSGTRRRKVGGDLHAKRASGLRYDQMAVLVRSAEHARAIGAALRAARLPVAFDTEPKGQAPWWWASADAQHAVSALRLVRSPADDESALVLLRKWARLPRRRLRCDPPQRAPIAADEPSSGASAVAAASPPSGGGDAARCSRPTDLTVRGVAADGAPGGLHRCCRWCSATIRPRRPPAPRPDGRFGGRCKHVSRSCRHLPPADETAEPGSARRRGGGGGGARPGRRQPPAELRGGGRRRTWACSRCSGRGLEWEVVFLPGWEEGDVPTTAPPPTTPPPPPPSRRARTTGCRRSAARVRRPHALPLPGRHHVRVAAAVVGAVRSADALVVPQVNPHEQRPLARGRRARPCPRPLGAKRVVRHGCSGCGAKLVAARLEGELGGARAASAGPMRARETRWARAHPRRRSAGDRRDAVAAVSAAAAPLRAGRRDRAGRRPRAPRRPSPRPPSPCPPPRPRRSSPRLDDVLSAPARDEARRSRSTCSTGGPTRARLACRRRVPARQPPSVAAPSAVDYELEFVKGESGGTADGASLELAQQVDGPRRQRRREEGAKKRHRVCVAAAGARGGGGRRHRRRRRRGGGGRGRVPRRRDRVRLAPAVALGNRNALEFAREPPRPRRFGCGAPSPPEPAAAAARPTARSLSTTRSGVRRRGAGSSLTAGDAEPATARRECVWQGDDVIAPRLSPLQ